MTPLEQIEDLKANKDKAKPYRIPAIGAAIIGLVLMVLPMFGSAATAWFGYWVIGMLLQVPNWAIVFRDFAYNSAINDIHKTEAEAALKEKYGRT